MPSLETLYILMETTMYFIDLVLHAANVLHTATVTYPRNSQCAYNVSQPTYIPRRRHVGSCRCNEPSPVIRRLSNIGNTFGMDASVYRVSLQLVCPIGGMIFSRAPP